jgi:hypothetical protein
MKVTAHLIAGAVGGLAIGAFLVWHFQPKRELLPPPLFSLEKMGHLVSVKVNYADVIEFTENRALGIPWSQWEVRYGGTRVLLVAKGDCSVATDLRLAKYEEMDTAKRQVTMVLPAPTTLQARVNHAPADQGGSRLYAVSNQGIEAIIPGDSSRTKAVSSALALAQTKVEEACKASDVIAAAKANAETVLKGSFSAVGWNTRIRWK